MIIKGQLSSRLSITYKIKSHKLCQAFKLLYDLLFQSYAPISRLKSFLPASLAHHFSLPTFLRVFLSLPATQIPSVRQTGDDGMPSPRLSAGDTNRQDREDPHCHSPERALLGSHEPGPFSAHLVSHNLALARIHSTQSLPLIRHLVIAPTYEYMPVLF